MNSWVHHHADNTTNTIADDGTRLMALKSFMWCVVDRLDSCTNICTTACGRENDVLNSPKQRHYSIDFGTPLKVSTATEDVEQFVFRGSFSNDGTFPVMDAELLDPRFHSFGDDSQVSVARSFDSDNGRQTSRGVIREYFEQCAGEREEKISGHFDPRQVSCRMSTKNRNTQVAGLASGRGQSKGLLEIEIL